MSERSDNKSCAASTKFSPSETHKNGWKVDRTTGSHFIYKKVGNPISVSLPNHGKKDLSYCTLHSLERGTGLSFIR